jgi:hypothetical protein
MRKNTFRFILAEFSRSDVGGRRGFVVTSSSSEVSLSKVGRGVDDRELGSLDVP